MVDRDFAMLYQLGELYRPASTSVMSELTDSEIQELKRLLSYRYALPVSDSRYLSTMVLDVEKLESASSLPSFDVAQVGKDFVGAIKNANETDLVTRGPLDLKSSDVIPPQIVVDQEVCGAYKFEFLLTEILFLPLVRVFWPCSPAEGARVI